MKKSFYLKLGNSPIFRIRLLPNILFLTFAVSHFTFDVFAQQPTQEWVKRFRGPNNSGCSPSSLALDPQGNVYVAGVVTQTGQKVNYSLIKYNSLGVLQWTAYYNNHDSTDDYTEALAVDSSGNAYITGYSGYNFGPYTFLTVKFNTNGIFQWARTYGIGAGYSVTVDRQQNVIVTGGENINGTTIKYTSNGDSIWVRIFNPGNNRLGYGLVVKTDDSNNIYVVGSSNIPGFQNDFHIIKYSSNGTQLWWNFYNGPQTQSQDIARDVVIDKFGNVYITGASLNFGVTNFDYATVKYNSAGVQQWVRRYNGNDNSNDYASSIVLDNTNNLFVTGTSASISNWDDFLTIKYNSSGDSIWVKRYNGSGNSFDNAYSIAIDTIATNIYVLGRSVNQNNAFDITTIKYSSNGILQWVGRYPGVPAVFNGSLKVDNQANVYVTGGNSDSGTSADCMTIKYSDPIGIISTITEYPYDFRLDQCFPNPFNSETIIKFDISKIENYVFEIFDVTGRKVKEVFNTRIAPGKYKINFNGNELASGIYFYVISVSTSLNATVFKDSKKMVLIK